MRRPICAACNRNVKVTSSSEITAQVYCNDMSNRSSSAITSKNSSRRSSFSAIVTKSHPSHHSLIKSGKCCVPNKKCSNIMTKKTNISSITKKGDNVAYSNSIVQTTRNLASTNSNASINQFCHHCENDNNSSNRSNCSFSSNKKGEQSRYIDYNKQRLVLRPDSPTSPIPTRRASEYIVSKTDIVYPSCPIQFRETSENENTNKGTVVQQRRLLSEQKWTAILSQQQQLLSAFIQGDENDGDLELIRDNITKLVKTTTNQEQFETTLVETQFKILQKFATMLLMQQQKYISSFTVYDHEIASPKKAIRKINSNESESELLLLKTMSWQTKLEYSATRLRWGLCRWVGSFLVGTGNIEEQEYDSLGYPKGITVSGTCVTTELSLLPKSRQKYYKPNHDGKREIICHKYIINLNREQRLTKFQLLDEKNWVKDASVTKCEFSMKPENGKAKHCTVEFGLFNRRHHCRSCGRIFCQAHSSNVLPLFISNGEERGEWSRVCDICFFKSINSKYLTRA
ncbi:MAG: hypothetical protein EXX96DRAFT_82081 [Benjaminiella poitrasii]|nr:MAG: hypothetical protein EXX96DRAFT_82081 [Benjaminiella poitrasii]